MVSMKVPPAVGLKLLLSSTRSEDKGSYFFEKFGSVRSLAWPV
jgi:hypothetical protein